MLDPAGVMLNAAGAGPNAEAVPDPAAAGPNAGARPNPPGVGPKAEAEPDPAGAGPLGTGAYAGTAAAGDTPNGPGSCRNVWVIGSGSQPATGSTAAVSARSSRAVGR
jgi:hypothetical protein